MFRQLKSKFLFPYLVFLSLETTSFTLFIYMRHYHIAIASFLTFIISITICFIPIIVSVTPTQFLKCSFDLNFSGYIEACLFNACYSTIHYIVIISNKFLWCPAHIFSIKKHVFCLSEHVSYICVLRKVCNRKIIIWNRNKNKERILVCSWAPELATSSKILKLTTHLKNRDEVLVSMILFFNCISFQVGK